MLFTLKLRGLFLIKNVVGFFSVFDASGKPIKRSGMDAFGHFGPTADDELLSKLEPPHLSHEYHEVPVVFDEHQADARSPFTSSDLNLEVPATALVSGFGPSGNYPRPGLTSYNIICCSI